MEPDYTTQARKKYAVVKFLLDSSYSEIPTIWLIENNDTQECWWPPRTANSALLITNYATPNYNRWDRYEVDIIKYCTSLESARKNAADANYNTTDEDCLGRGKRQHVPYNRYTSDEEKENNHSRKNITKKKQTRTVISATPSCLKNFSLTNKNNNEIDFEERLEIEDDNQAVLQYVLDQEKSVQTGGEEYNLDDIPIVINESLNIENVATDIESNLNINQSLKQILRMLASTNVMLKDLMQRTTKLERALKNRIPNLNLRNDNLIVGILPLNTIESIKQFDELLETTNEAVCQFKDFLLKIGRNNPKDNIQRCLKKIFTNECVITCSWKGIRNNFRISNLYFIKIMRSEVTSQYVGFTESDFDYIVAEWLRFAKQRKQRESEKDKGTEERGIQDVI